MRKYNRILMCFGRILVPSSIKGYNFVFGLKSKKKNCDSYSKYLQDVHTSIQFGIWRCLFLSNLSVFHVKASYSKIRYRRCCNFLVKPERLRKLKRVIKLSQKLKLEPSPAFEYLRNSTVPGDPRPLWIQTRVALTVGYYVEERKQGPF